MKIIQKVTVKQVLTEKSKQKLLHFYLEQRQQLQKESDQLHFETKKRWSVNISIIKIRSMITLVGK
ncbi:YlqD family protein, partial [Listeria riparia]